MDKEALMKILKNKNNRVICIILIIGVVLMAIAGTGKNTSVKDEDKEYISNSCDEEKRLENILSQIDGVGDVSVMITYYSSSEKDIAYETKVSSREKEESEDKKAVMTGGEPMVLKEVFPKVKGVIVIADGGGSDTVKRAVSEAVSASLDVPAHRVCIFKKEE